MFTISKLHGQWWATFVWNAPEHKPFHSGHAPVANHHEIGVHSLGHLEEHVRRIPFDIVGLGGDLALSIGSHLRTDAVAFLVQLFLCGCNHSGIEVFARRDPGHDMDDVDGCTPRLRQVERLSDSDSRPL